jgi:creatinine amidohydrolase
LHPNIAGKRLMAAPWAFLLHHFGVRRKLLQTIRSSIGEIHLSTPYTARPYILHEASYAQLKKLKPNVAVLPWGAEEAHNYHLPHGTDVIEGVAVGEAAVELANKAGARCLLLPCVPFGNDNTQLSQIATITMRSSTQQAVLLDIADSLARQGIDRLVILNCHGGNEFSSMIRDVMLAIPIFIVRIHIFQIAPQAYEVLEQKQIDHADEMETSLLLHLTPEWVAPLATAGDGATTPSKIPSLIKRPGVWFPRDWEALSKDTGAGNPRAATAAKGAHIFKEIVSAIVPILKDLSAAKNGDFPFVIRKP